ncbi:MAG TPA: YIP1 family protein [Pyrinomonadaceae bacterium]|nr:YIP1 family protein [Pyrinomonadaceae bacterium]
MSDLNPQIIPSPGTQQPEFHAPPPPPAPELAAPRPTQLRIPAIVLFVLGLLILTGGVAKFIPGGISSGGALCFWGLLLFGLSFVRLPRTVKDSPPALSTMERITGIFYEPTRVFKSVGAHPRWLAAFLIIAFLNIGYAVAFRQRLTPERIAAHVTDKMAQTPFIPPEVVERAKVEQLEELKNPVQQAGSAVKSMVGLFAYFAFIAALLFLGVLVFGGKINYWQSFVAAIYAALPISIIQRVLSFVLLYLKSPDEIHPILGQETLVQDNLGVLFSPAESPVLFVIASAFGLLAFYALWLRATGLRNAGEKVSKSAAWGTAIVLWVLGMVLVVIFTALFPAFIS